MCYTFFDEQKERFFLLLVKVFFLSVILFKEVFPLLPFCNVLLNENAKITLKLKRKVNEKTFD